MISHLHSAHQGVSNMTNRANECVFWPGITSDIQAARTQCTMCNINAPSQSKLPAIDPIVPTAPFQAVATDYLKLHGKGYLLTVDRFSNWPDLREAPAHSPTSGADGLLKASRELFATFGVPEEVSSDGGPEYMSKAYQDFIKVWGVKHRLSAAYNSQSNGRAEVTVKTMKRLLCDNVGPNGSLNTDAVTRAMLQLRNTPESDSGLSPAQILLGRTLRDTLPLLPPIPRKSTVFDAKSCVSQVWKDVWAAKENALKSRLARQVETLSLGARELPPLIVGDTVRVQNQTGSHPNKWDKTGVVMQVGSNDQYIIRMDGSRRLTLRNRRFLRKMIPPSFAVGSGSQMSLHVPAYHQFSPMSSPLLPEAPVQQVQEQSAPSQLSIPASPEFLQPSRSPLGPPASEHCPGTPAVCPDRSQRKLSFDASVPKTGSPDLHRVLEPLAPEDNLPRRSSRERKKPERLGID